MATIDISSSASSLSDEEIELQPLAENGRKHGPQNSHRKREKSKKSWKDDLDLQILRRLEELECHVKDQIKMVEGEVSSLNVTVRNVEEKVNKLAMMLKENIKENQTQSHDMKIDVLKMDLQAKHYLRTDSVSSLFGNGNNLVCDAAVHLQPQEYKNEQLWKCVEMNNNDGVQYWLGVGADVGYQRGAHLKSVFHLAAELKHIEILYILVARALEEHKNVLVPDRSGLNPFHAAARVGSSSCLQAMIEASPKLTRKSTDEVDAMPEEKRKQKTREECLKLINATEEGGWTPLLYAAKNVSPECIKLLLLASADVTATTQQGETPLLVLGKTAQMKGVPVERYEQCVELLLTKKAEVKTRSCDSGDTALHQAADLQAFSAVKQLLDNGAAVNIRNNKNMTPLHFAALRGSYDILQELLNRKADANSVDKCGNTVLLNAAESGSKKCVKLLLEQRTDLSAETKSGKTAYLMIRDHIQNPLTFFTQLFSSCITSEGKQNADIGDFSVTFNYHLLFHKDSSKQTATIEKLIRDHKTLQELELLRHPLLESFLSIKWEKVRLFFIIMLAIYTFFVFNLTIYLYLLFQQNTSHVYGSHILTNLSLSALASNWTDTVSCNWFAWQIKEVIFVSQYHYGIIITRWLLAASVVLVILEQSIQVMISWKQFIREYETYLKLAAVLSSIVTLGYNESQVWRCSVMHHASAYAILFAWLEMMTLIGRFPACGPYVLVLYKVSKDILKLLGAFVCLLLGFSFSFHILFHNQDSFQNPAISALKTVVMMTGEFDFGDLFSEGSISNGTSHLFFILFVLFVSIVLTNILIGFAVADIQSLQNTGLVRRLQKQAEFISFLEDVASSKVISKLLPKTWERRLKRYLKVQDEVKIYPGFSKDRCQNLSNHIVQNCVAIVTGHPCHPQQNGSDAGNTCLLDARLMDHIEEIQAVKKCLSEINDKLNITFSLPK